MKEIWKAVDKAVAGSGCASAWDVIATTPGGKHQLPVSLGAPAPPLPHVAVMAAAEDGADLSVDDMI